MRATSTLGLHARSPWELDWRDVIGHSALYALVLSLLLTADAALRTTSLDAVPHPLLYFVPLLVAIGFLSALARSTGITQRVDDTVSSPVLLYVTLCLLGGTIWLFR